jgi:hypothetical protein
MEKDIKNGVLYITGNSDKEVILTVTQTDGWQPKDSVTATLTVMKGKDIIGNDPVKLQGLKADLAIEGVSPIEEDGTGGLLPVNLHFDEQNRYSSDGIHKNVLRPDNEPHFGTTPRIIATDRDLRKATVTIFGGEIKGKWKLIHDNSLVKFWKLGPGGYTEVFPDQESEEVTLPYTVQLLVEGIAVVDPANIKLVFSPKEFPADIYDNVKLRIFEYWMQEVTTEPGSLPIVNPCGVGVNKAAKFKLTRLTPSIVSPAEINWSISAGASHAQIVGSKQGQDINVLGVSAGDFTVKAKWRDIEETLSARVVEAKVVNLSIVILATDNMYGTPTRFANSPEPGWTLATTEAKVSEQVALVNEIYKQWNMSFNAKILYLVFDKYRWDNYYAQIGYLRLCDLMNTWDPDPQNQSIELVSKVFRNLCPKYHLQG